MDDDPATECSCGQPRYKQPNTPAETMLYLPLSRQLAAMIANDNIREMLLYRANRQEAIPGDVSDIFDGQFYQRLTRTRSIADDSFMFSNDLDLAISLFVDGSRPSRVVVLI